MATGISMTYWVLFSGLVSDWVTVNPSLISPYEGERMILYNTFIYVFKLIFPSFVRRDKRRILTLTRPLPSRER
jgi:hypothetical protein